MNLMFNKYKKIKENKKILFLKPHYIILLPLIFLVVIYKRCMEENDIVLLTITDISTINNKPDVYNKETYNYEIVNNFDKANLYLNERIEIEANKNKYLQEVKLRFIRGDEMHILRKNDEEFSFIFLSKSSANLVQVAKTIKLNDESFSIYDVYTTKVARGKKLYEKLFFKTIKEMNNLHFKFLYLWVMPHNKVSIGVHNKLGLTNVSNEFTRIYKFIIPFTKNKKLNNRIIDYL